MRRDTHFAPRTARDTAKVEQSYPRQIGLSAHLQPVEGVRIHVHGGYGSTGELLRGRRGSSMKCAVVTVKVESRK